MGKIIVDKKRVIIKKEGTRIYPTLVDLEITPKVEEQIFNHEGEYGYDKVTVRPIELKLQDKEADIQKEQQVITADDDYDALSSVTINAPELQNKTIIPSKEEQIIEADGNYIALNTVNIKAIPDNYIEPTGTLEITANGSYDVTNYKNAKVNTSSTSGIHFFDYDGTLLHKWSLEDLNDKHELPELPTKEGFVCKGWNWTLDELKQENREIIVGANYITDDEKTRICLTLDTENLSPVLGIGQSKANGIEIDWGDGTVEISNNIVSAQYGNTTPINMKHAYKEKGEYIITLKPLNNTTIYLFGNVSSYSQIIWNESGTYYANYIYQTSIKKIYLGNNIELKGYCFQGLKQLEEISISTYVKTIPSYAFASCLKLKHITIPKGCLDIYGYTFDGINIESISLPYGVRTIQQYSFQNCNDLKNVTIPSTVTNIGNYAFKGCSLLRNIYIPHNVTTLGTNVFDSCSMLEEIIIPDSVKTIGKNLLYSCSSLKNAVLSNGITTIPDYCFYNCSNLVKIIIPNNVKTIGKYVFQKCSKLQSAILSNNLSSIDNQAFASCSILESIKIPDSVTTLGAQCFQYDYDLKYIELSNNISTLGNACFQQDMSLQHAYIPPSITTIPTNLFNLCASMIYIDFSDYDTIPILSGSNAFSGIPSACEIIVPDNLYDEWIVQTNWSSVANNIVKFSESRLA